MTPNQERAERAVVLLERCDTYDEGDFETAVVDALTDLMHYCHQYKISLGDVLKRAEMHFVAEMEEEAVAKNVD